MLTWPETAGSPLDLEFHPECFEVNVGIWHRTVVLSHWNSDGHYWPTGDISKGSSVGHITVHVCCNTLSKQQCTLIIHCTLYMNVFERCATGAGVGMNWKGEYHVVFGYKVTKQTWVIVNTLDSATSAEVGSLCKQAIFFWWMRLVVWWGLH